MDRDDVDFFAEPDPWDRPTRSERRRELIQRRKRRRRRIIVPLITLIVIAGLGLGALVGGRSLTSRFGTTPDYTGSGTGEALIVVKPGDTATDIAATMLAQGVIKSEKAFAKAAKGDPRALGIQPGTYKLHKQMSGAAALQLILSPAARLLSRVTVPEGMSVAATLKLIRTNPFPDAPTNLVRAGYYRYRFADPKSGAWWTRTRVGEYLPPISREIIAASSL